MNVEINVQVRLTSPLHIGSGALADSVADKPLLKNAQRLPLIPGSSLRGKTRHACEQIASSLQLGSICTAPYADAMCRIPQLCPICTIFGSPSAISTIRFSNLTLGLRFGLQEPADVQGIPWKQHLEWTEIRSGVGLNRGRRTAQEEILYTTETHRISSALNYYGTIVGTLEYPRQAALLIAGLGLIKTLGGGRSRGLGWCEVSATVKLDQQAVDHSELLKELAQWKS